MMANVVIAMLLGTIYIGWCTYALLTGKGSITFTSSRWLPSAAVFMAGKKGFAFFHLFTSFLLRRWRLLYLSRHLFGIGMLALLVIIFYYRLYHLDLLDFVWLPLALFLTIVFHEWGHAVSYAKANIFIRHVKVGLPIAGRTSVLSSADMLQHKEKACIGMAGSAMNLLAASISLLLLLLITHPFLLYMVLTNFCFFSNSLYPVTRDYKDITRHISM